MKALELKVPPLVLLSVFLLTTLGAAKLEIAIIPFHTAIPGFIVAAAGVVLGLSGVHFLRRMKTTLDPRFPGKANKLVDTGIFKVTRNPVYLGMLLFQLGVSLTLNSAVGLAMSVVMVIYLTRFQIIPEERMMAENFGADFHRYCLRTRRWLGRHRKT